MHNTRLFITDADQELRLRLQMLLHQEPGLYMVGIAAHARGLLAQVEVSQPDVLLLDWFLPGQPIADVLADLHALEGRPQIVVLSVRPEEENAAMTAGADACITKTEPPDEFLAILQTTRDAPGDGSE